MISKAIDYMILIGNLYGQGGSPKFRTSLSGSGASWLRDCRNHAKFQVRTQTYHAPRPKCADLNNVTHFSLCKKNNYSSVLP